MTMRPIAAALAAALFGCPTVVAQDCPRERAELVPRQIVIGNTQDCGGIEVNIGGVQLHAAAGGCPLFIIYEPEHHVARPTDRDTMVELVHTLPITHLTFECQLKWFLIIPYDSACRPTGSRVMGAVPLLRTIPCPINSSS